MTKKKTVVLIVIIIFFSLVIAGATAYLVLKHFNSQESENEYQEIASSYANDIDNTGEATAPEVDVELAENPIDFESLINNNKDIYSWIYIPDTNINYPVLQSDQDDNFYLDHNINKQYSFSGAIYSQSCNSLDYSDRVTVLYGHNMANGSMFANLHKFENKDFFDEHRYIYIYTPQHKLTYEIVSAFVYDDRHIMNSFDFSDDEIFQNYLDMLKNPRSVSSNVKSDIELTTEDKILTLSTCLNSGNGRYLVQGVLIKDELTK